MPKDKKQSRLKKVAGQEGKRFTASPNTEIPAEQQPSTFSLRYLTGDYCLTNCEIEEKAAFASKLYRLSQLTWKEIQSQNRHKLGYEKIPQDEIKTSIPAHVTEEVNLIAFRFDGKKPMVGYRDGVTFYVLFLDRSFTLYDHG
jgi:hypothetical protein